MPKIEKAKAVRKSDRTTKKSAAKKTATKTVVEEKARRISSKVVYDGPLFRVLRDRVVEPGGCRSNREVIRHNGSVVILAVDNAKSKKNPWVVMEHQYRYAAGQFLWELPAGKIEVGEDPVEGGKRELAEETGYAARKWKLLLDYFPSPGFLGESMKIFLAEELAVGEAHPEADEKIELRLIRLNEVLKMIDKGIIIDGKTLAGIQFYARKIARKR